MQAMGAGKLLEMEVPLFLQGFNYATGVFVDSTGVVFIAEYTNIRRISAFAPNIITTIAGTCAFYYVNKPHCHPVGQHGLNSL